MGKSNNSAFEKFAKFADVAKTLDIPILDPALEILSAEAELLKKLEDPNAKEWDRINEWKQQHPRLTKALEELMSSKLTTKTKAQAIKTISGVTRGGGAGRDKRGGTQKSVHKTVQNKQNSKRTVPSSNSSTIRSAIKGGNNMATKPKKDKYDKEDSLLKNEQWKKKKKTPTNHPDWYIGKYAPTLVNANFGVKKTGEYFPKGRAYHPSWLPNVISIELGLVYPSEPTSSFEQAISTLYTKLRAVNSGTTVYSVSDLEAYVLNVRALRALVAILHRYVKIGQMADIYDAKIPETLARACAATAGTGAALMNNLVQLRTLGTQLDIQSRSMLPLNLPLLDRTEWLFDNVFADSDDVKPQWYVFKTREILLHKITASNTYTAIHVDIDSIPDILTVVAPILSSYLSTYITNVIAGDIIKAYGANAIRPLISDWNAFTPCQPVYDEDILQQIENLYSLDWRCENKPRSPFQIHWNTDHWENTFVSTLDATAIVKWINGISVFDSCPSCLAFSGGATWSSIYVNSFRNETTPGQLLSYTRLKFRVSGFAMSNQDNPTYITGATLQMSGSEIVVNMEFIVTDSIATWCPQHVSTVAGDINLDAAPFIGLFNWHPMQQWYGVNWAPTSINWDFKNFAQLSAYDICDLHAYANYALAEPRYDFVDQGRWAATVL